MNTENNVENIVNAQSKLSLCDDARSKKTDTARSFPDWSSTLIIKIDFVIFSCLTLLSLHRIQHRYDNANFHEFSIYRDYDLLEWVISPIFDTLPSKSSGVGAHLAKFSSAIRQ